MKRTLLEVVMHGHPELDEHEATGRILRGDVKVGNVVLTKPGARVPVEALVVLRSRPRFASRAGDKLDGALSRLRLDVRDMTLIDAGCSAGGFTDCLLQRGAALVHAVDVGKGQLAWKLRSNPKVRVWEGSNVMSLRREDLVPAPLGAVCDLSFRSIRGAASHLVRLAGGSWVLALVKPQFEWSEPAPEFHGVVRDLSTVVTILDEVERDLGGEGLRVADRFPSGLPGRKGNQEFFFLIRPAPGPTLADTAAGGLPTET